MTKISVSLAALMLMAACSATASPNVATAAAAPAAAQPPAQGAPVAGAEAATIAAAPTHTTRAPSRMASEPNAASRAAMLGGGVSCEVRVQPTANGVFIQAVAHSARPFEGDYELVITKSGGGGSSDVTQSGPFSAAAGETVTLGSTELSAGGRFRTALVVRDQAGEVCRQERRS